MTSATLAPRARRDMAAIARWISRDNPRAARAFRDAAVAAAARIGRYPQIGRVRSELLRPVFRFLALPGFPYLMVYNAERMPPQIVAIVHGARDLPSLLRDLDWE